MSSVINKWQMAEEDIKLNFITPALTKKWEGLITMETKITDGRINLRGNLVSRAQPKKQTMSFTLMRITPSQL